jgi:hypothetical protein
MIPSSANCGCGSSTSLTPSTVNGTFGCNGLPACITVVDGVITAATNGSSSGVSGSAGCSGNFVPCITVTNGIITSLTNREISGGGGSSVRTHNVSLLGMEPVTVIFNTGDIADDEFTFITDFEPTNARISVYQFNTGYAGLEIDLAYSTDNVTFTPVGINLPIVGIGDYFITDTGSFSIPGTPSIVYWRPVFKNSTGSAKSVIFASLNITVWS